MKKLLAYLRHAHFTEDRSSLIPGGIRPLATFFDPFGIDHGDQRHRVAMGLANGLTLREFASLLDYLEALAKKK